MAALKSVAMVVGLSVLALSQATAPQIYVLSAIPGDAGLKNSTVIPLPPLALTRSNGRLYLGIDPAAYPGVTIQLDGVTIGTASTLNIASGQGLVTTAIQSKDTITIQVSQAPFIFTPQ